MWTCLDSEQNLCYRAYILSKSSSSDRSDGLRLNKQNLRGFQCKTKQNKNPSQRNQVRIIFGGFWIDWDENQVKKKSWLNSKLAPALS